MEFLFIPFHLTTFLFLEKYKIANGSYTITSPLHLQKLEGKVSKAEAWKGEQDKDSVPAVEILLSKLGYLLYCFHPWGFSSW